MLAGGDCVATLGCGGTRACRLDDGGCGDALESHFSPFLGLTHA